ncbi:recombinase family protein [Sediminibacillus dalangtanensis]|uniref:recombinase family protein n=1 Tax=Sediminibacillus dalangtanensis TaxID=2729421 RepID=UPI001FD7FE10|nr:recombinase family protein [Sediminibacillus dalangtanensis]
MSKVAAIYTRVSTEEQKTGYSLDAQENTLKEYAKNKGYEIYDVYRDGGYSGKNFDRPEIQRLFKDLNKDRVDVILIWKVDRLSRNNTDVVNLIDNELTPNNKKLVVTSIEMDSSTPTGYMFISLLGTFARYERATIIDRVNSGMKQRAEQGYWNGGIILGYDSKNKKLVVNEEESKIVKEIFELRSIGKGYKVITNILNGKGLKTKKGKDFSIAGVKAVLHNHVYRGKLVWRKHAEWSTKRRKGKTDPIIVQGHHEPIISEELWNKVQAVNEAQKKSFTTNRNFNGNLLLTGLLKCPKCGAGTVMSKAKGRKGDYIYYYMCQAFHTKGKSVCSSNLIKKK